MTDKQPDWEGVTAQWESGGSHLILDERQVKEIGYALYYEQECQHGTAGHNHLMLIAAMAKALGFRLGPDRVTLFMLAGQAMPVVGVPAGSRVQELPRRDFPGSA